MEGKRKLAVIGTGAMAQDLKASLERVGGFSIGAALVSHDHKLSAALFSGVEIFRHPEQLLAWRPSLVIECASHSAVRNSVPLMLRMGIDTIIVSIGSLSDPALLQQLEDAAVAGSSRLTIVSGAIGGLDVLRAAKLAGLTSVEYRGVKPAFAWKETPAEEYCELGAISEPTAFFKGNAGEASRLFPKNANVTAAVALAGIGFDRTSVTLVADPDAVSNCHQITARGAFGEFSIHLRNEALPGNPKTSRLAALSLQQAVIRHFEHVEM